MTDDIAMMTTVKKVMRMVAWQRMYSQTRRSVRTEEVSRQSKCDTATISEVKHINLNEQMYNKQRKE